MSDPYSNILAAVAQVVGGNQPDPTGKPNWFSGRDKGDSSGVASLAGCWWPPPEVLADTPVAIVLPGPSRLLQAFPMQGHKQVEDAVHVRVLAGHADLPTMLSLIAVFHDSIPAAFDTHMTLLGQPNVLAANCGDQEFLDEASWGGTVYIGLELVVRVERVIPVTYTA